MHKYLKSLVLNKEVVDKYFTGATSRIEGMGLDEIAKEVLAKHFFAFSKKDIPVDRLPVGGVYQWKRKGEFHLFNPQTIHLLQYSTRMNDYNTFKKYSKLVNDQSEKACTLAQLVSISKTTGLPFQLMKLNLQKIFINDLQLAQ